ncbi:MAG: RecB-family nuclease [Candidatus Undinarchaeales archaeon]|nr:RecB-family nuclease [Candidatus Undinarchaeales archaeon]MDP7493244.1 RecB-family nuclease [Candidatus Undinarchaeales archaeon]
MTLIVVYHDVANARKLEEFAKTVFAFNVDILVLSRPMTDAKTRGVKEVQHLAWTEGRTVMAVDDLFEAVNLFGPDKAYLIEHTKESTEIDTEAIGGELKGEGEVMLVFSGVNPPGLKGQVETGVSVHLPEIKGLSEIGLAAIILYEVRRHQTI